MTSVLGLERVGIAYGGVPVVDGISLDVARGETLVLVGASGSGKSSLLRALLGLVVPPTGTVRIDGRVASRDGEIVLAPEERGLSVVFQDLALWPHMTVHQNLAFAMEARKIASKERDDRIAAMLERLGLRARAARRPHELSGGERQRVALARALVVEPRAVLFDEPLTNLDVVLKRDLRALLRETLAGGSKTALYVTHDPDEARVLGDRVAVLENGKIVQCGTWDALRAEPGSAFVKALTEGGG